MRLKVLFRDMNNLVSSFRDTSSVWILLSNMSQDPLCITDNKLFFKEMTTTNDTHAVKKKVHQKYDLKLSVQS